MFSEDRLTLRIQRARRVDAGTYSVDASNAVGTASAEITLMVTGGTYHWLCFIAIFITWNYMYTLFPQYINSHEKSKIPFSYMLCLFCKRAYRGTKPEESFG